MFRKKFVSNFSASQKKIGNKFFSTIFSRKFFQNFISKIFFFQISKIFQKTIFFVVVCVCLFFSDRDNYPDAINPSTTRVVSLSKNDVTN